MNMNAITFEIISSQHSTRSTHTHPTDMEGPKSVPTATHPDDHLPTGT